MKISLKMNLLLVINMVMMIAVVGYGLTKMQIIGEQLTTIAKEDIPLIESLTKIIVLSVGSRVIVLSVGSFS